MCCCALSVQWNLDQYFTLHFSSLLSVFCWNHRTEIYLTGDWLFGALLAEVSQFPLFRGIIWTWQRALGPSGQETAVPVVKMVKRHYGHVAWVTHCRDFCGFFSSFFLLFFFFYIVFFKCCLSLSCSLSLTHTHSAVCLHNIWSLKHWSPCKTKTKLCFETNDYKLVVLVCSVKIYTKPSNLLIFQTLRSEALFSFRIECLHDVCSDSAVSIRCIYISNDVSISTIPKDFLM